MESRNNQRVKFWKHEAYSTDVVLKKWYKMFMIVLVKELLSTKNKLFIFS